MSFKSRCRAFRDGGTGSVGPGFFFRSQVSRLRFFFSVSALSIGRAPWGCLGRTEPIPPRAIVGAFRDGGSGSVGPELSAGGSQGFLWGR